MSSNVLVINGSARLNSNSTKLVRHLLGEDVDVIELIENRISHFDYKGGYPEEDNFQSIADRMTKSDVIILSTPVYWYSMSGPMKVFIDRWTDLVSTHKEKGRALKGKKIAVIAQSTSEAMPNGFELPIKLTAEYMDMEYIGGIFWDMRNPIEESHLLLSEIKNWKSNN